MPPHPPHTRHFPAQTGTPAGGGGACHSADHYSVLTTRRGARMQLFAAWQIVNYRWWADAHFLPKIFRKLTRHRTHAVDLHRKEVLLMGYILFSKQEIAQDLFRQRTRAVFHT